MKSALMTTILFLILAASARSACPEMWIDTPDDDVFNGELVIVHSVVDGEFAGFEWRLNRDIEFSGQGTQRISFVVPELENGEIISVGVTVKGLASECSEKINKTFRVINLANAPEISIPLSERQEPEDRKNIDRFLEILHSYPRTRAEIVITLPPTEKRSATLVRLEQIQSQLRERGVDPKRYRISIVSGEKSELRFSVVREDQVRK